MCNKKEHKFRYKQKCYDNILLKDVNGEIIGFIDQKRAKFYISRKLAVFDEVNKILKLNFKVSKKTVADEPFYLQPRENKCVVCGSTSELSKHHCIPWMFRKHYPDNWKKHSSHDVLVLCEIHHRDYEKKANLLKEFLGSAAGVENGGKLIYPSWYIYGKKILGLESNKKQIPHEHYISKKSFYLDKIEKELGEVSFSLSKLKDKMKVFIEKEHITKINKIIQHFGCNEFAKIWRNHFVSTMQPKCLPDKWDINYIPLNIKELTK
jgi:hypothetical protein